MSQTDVAQQLWQLLQMALFGWCLMLTAQQKQALAICGRWSYRQKMVGDFLFCLCWALLFWLFLLRVNGGLLRNYIFFGLLGGCAVYYGLCRPICRGLCLRLARSILWLWHWLWKVLLAPWRLLGRVLGRFIWQPCRKFFQEKCKAQQELVEDAENIIENENNFSSFV